MYRLRSMLHSIGHRDKIQSSRDTSSCLVCHSKHSTTDGDTTHLWYQVSTQGGYLFSVVRPDGWILIGVGSVKFVKFTLTGILVKTGGGVVTSKWLGSFFCGPYVFHSYLKLGVSFVDRMFSTVILSVWYWCTRPPWLTPTTKLRVFYNDN